MPGTAAAPQVRSMCNLYGITTNQAAAGRLIAAGDDRRFDPAAARPSARTTPPCKKLNAISFEMFFAAAGTTHASSACSQVYTTFSTATPQVKVDADRERAEMLRVPVQRLNDAIETYFGSTYINDFNILGRTYRVTAQ